MSDVEGVLDDLQAGYIDTEEAAAAIEGLLDVTHDRGYQSGYEDGFDDGYDEACSNADIID